MTNIYYMKNMRLIYGNAEKGIYYYGRYNCASTLRESIDSIIKQTYENWEFIICDDGSSDNTLKIVQEYANKYPEKFIVLENKTNKGLNATLNRCLKASKRRIYSETGWG